MRGIKRGKTSIARRFLTRAVYFFFVTVNNRVSCGYICTRNQAYYRTNDQQDRARLPVATEQLAWIYPCLSIHRYGDQLSKPWKLQRSLDPFIEWNSLSPDSLESHLYIASSVPRKAARTLREKLLTTGKERHNPIVSRVSRRERSNNGGISGEFVRSIVARIKKLCAPLWG